jgi:SH3-like domain-containing protein
MKSHAKLLILGIIICSVFLALISFAQESEEPATTTTDAILPDFPYIAEITGDNLYIRSGSGTNFYSCGKLNKGDRVKVVGRVFSWSRIVPPEGSFSWISARYIDVDPEDPTVGYVTGDNVRVYAGSEYRKPLHSMTLQGKLSKGDKVKLLGEQVDDYQKIAPPPFAYLWVSTNFTKPILEPIESNSAISLASEMMTEEMSPDANDAMAEPTITAELTTPEKMMQRYNALRARIQSEQAKPMAEQDYAEIKKAMAEIAENKQAGKAARYAEFVVKQIEGFELAIAVDKQVKLQNEQLKKIREGIDRARNTRLAELVDMGRFAVVGKLQPFTTYGPGHYRVVDESGKTICSAVPIGSLSDMNLNMYLEQKVGLAGTIEASPDTPPGATVRFNEIVALN